MSATQPFLYGRKWRLLVRTWSGLDIEITDVRFTFHVEKSLSTAMQYGSVTIYNLSPNTETEIFKNGQGIILEAGYANGPYGVIFRAPIRQPIRGKENGTDYFLKLVCYAGDDILNIGFCNLTLRNTQTARDIIAQIARSSTVPFALSIEQGEELLNTGTLSPQQTQRGKTLFGPPGDYLRSIAINNNFIFYADDGVANFVPVSKPNPADAPELNATNGLIGFPQQVDKGVELRILINPNIRLGTWIKLNNQKIIQEEFPFESSGVLLDIDGLYRVIAITMDGDTRGNDWYYDLTTWSSAGNLPALVAGQNDSGVA